MFDLVENKQKSWHNVHTKGAGANFLCLFGYFEASFSVETSTHETEKNII